MDPTTERVRKHFDELGDGEWERLEATARGRVNFEIHRRMLAETISPGDRVLEIGAGPGRFTIELARLGALVTVTDVSAVQLELNERHTAEAGCENAVEARFLLDIRDVDSLGQDTFDAVVAYGGPLSYVFEDAERAFGHLVSAVRPGGVVVASVMASLGALRYFLPEVVDEIYRFGIDVYDHIISTGDLRSNPGTHTCRMFRWAELDSMIRAQPCRLLVASASNCMSLGDEAALERIEADPQRWTWFVNWEVSLCREPGVLDAGTHILFAASAILNVLEHDPPMTTRTAQCACGRVEITAEDEPVRIVACHCDFCQRRTGSVFSVHAYFAEDQVVEIRGETNIYNGLETNGVAAADGLVVDYHFCATCGSTIYWTFTRRACQREIGIAVGNFLDPNFPVPPAEYNTALRHHWVPPIPGADHFDAVPTAGAVPS